MIRVIAFFDNEADKEAEMSVRSHFSANEHYKTPSSRYNTRIHEQNNPNPQAKENNLNSRAIGEVNSIEIIKYCVQNIEYNDF